MIQQHSNTLHQQWPLDYPLTARVQKVNGPGNESLSACSLWSSVSRKDIPLKVEGVVRSVLGYTLVKTQYSTMIFQFNHHLFGYTEESWLLCHVLLSMKTNALFNSMNTRNVISITVTMISLFLLFTVTCRCLFYYVCIYCCMQENKLNQDFISPLS